VAVGLRPHPRYWDASQKRGPSNADQGTLNRRIRGIHPVLTRFHKTLLDKAGGRAGAIVREALAFLCARAVARKDERRIEMATKIAHLPTVRDLDRFDFTAQPSLDKAQILKLAACRWATHGAALLLLGARSGQDASFDCARREAIRQHRPSREAAPQSRIWQKCAAGRENPISSG
jgi:hypothetical protein